MTNKEILKANLLDILFEHRNKNYGAYALRKNYNYRLRWALGISLGISLILLMINFIGKTKLDVDRASPGPEIEISQVVPIEPKPPEEERPREHNSIAQIKDVIPIIVPDKNAPFTEVPDNDALDSAATSNVTRSGTPYEGTIKDTATTKTGNNSVSTETPQSEFRPSHKEAEFPGGREAFARFLQMRLETPDELEVGAKQAVIVRFMVDIDGGISKIEVVQSGGDKFDKEVIRVLRKMPKWIPAEQNNVKVPVYFTQVVTFQGVEQ